MTAEKGEEVHQNIEFYSNLIYIIIYISIISLFKLDFICLICLICQESYTLNMFFKKSDNNLVLREYKV